MVQHYFLWKIRKDPLEKQLSRRSPNLQRQLASRSAQEQKQSLLLILCEEKRSEIYCRTVNVVFQPFFYLNTLALVCLSELSNKSKLKLKSQRLSHPLRMRNLSKKNKKNNSPQMDLCSSF